MNTSGEAADQVMRMVLNGTEVLVKLSGAGAKQTALLIYSIIKEQKKTKGAARLSSMLSSGKPLKVYTFEDKDLPKFRQCAKEYGILYTVLKDKDKSDGIFDVMVRAEDASKILRITERFNLTKVDTATIKAEILREQEQKAKAAEAEKKEEAAKEEPADSKADTEKAESEDKDPPEKEKPEKSEADRITDELFSEPTQKEKSATANPTTARADTPERKRSEPDMTGSSPSEPSSAKGSTDREREGKSGRKSVRAELAEISREREKREQAEKSSPTRSKSKKKESKERSR